MTDRRYDTVTSKVLDKFVRAVNFGRERYDFNVVTASLVVIIENFNVGTSHIFKGLSALH